MKKILSFLFMSFLLIIPFTTQLWSNIDFPVFTGDLTKVEYRVVAEDNDVIVVVIDGQVYIVKTQK